MLIRLIVRVLRWRLSLFEYASFPSGFESGRLDMIVLVHWLYFNFAIFSFKMPSEWLVRTSICDSPIRIYHVLYKCLLGCTKV